MKPRDQGGTAQDTPITEEDWREVPRSGMLSHVITAVNAARGEAIVLGDENFVCHRERQLFPFLVAERERALSMEA